MSTEKTYTEMPWYDVSEWTPGHWYPMPVGFFARDQEEYIIDGYDLFYQDPACVEDIIPCDLYRMGPFTFSTALKIAEEHNGMRMLK